MLNVILTLRVVLGAGGGALESMGGFSTYR